MARRKQGSSLPAALGGPLLTLGGLVAHTDTGQREDFTSNSGPFVDGINSAIKK